MSYGLGIDTGGTYTDAVLVDLETWEVLKNKKVLTTRHDLSIGIRKAIEEVTTQGIGKHPQTTINLVGLSTTLATNAIAEGYGGRVCLILVGYDQALLDRHGFGRGFITRNIAYVSGGYDLYGNESSALDETSVRDVVLKNKDHVESFGVSCFFGSRNPSQEMRVREIIEELCDLPVTCGHDLTTKLNSVLRAQTVAINASLIPLLRSLIVSVQQTLSSLSISAPLLVVRGDGSLMKADVAVRRPIETILSGPAASIAGAQRLSGKTDCWVVDIGGTTTDIGKMTGGRIDLNKTGSTIADKRTMVESADIYTIGLGGDSMVQVDDTGEIELGPRRVVPLCLLAESYPMILEQLRDWNVACRGNPSEGFFALFWQAPPYDLSEADMALLEKIRMEPLPLSFSGREGFILSRRLENFEKLCLILRAGFTPTDALHALGCLHLWNAEASRVGAGMLAENAGQSLESFCRAVVQKVSVEVAAAMIGKIVTDRIGHGHWNSEKTARFFISEAIKGAPTSEMHCRLSLTRPIVAIGAPAAAYMRKTAEILNASLILPPHAEVANAVGAVVGVVMNRKNILITPLEGGRVFRAHLPDGVKDFMDLEEAVDSVNRDLLVSLEQIAKKSGAGNPSIQVERIDRVVQGIHLDTELIFTSTGRPAMAQ